MSITNSNHLTSQRLLTLEEARATLRISRWSMQRLLDNRQLATVNIGRRRFVRPADLDQLIDDLRSEALHD
jgi:hypothetical protein